MRRLIYVCAFTAAFAPGIVWAQHQGHEHKGTAPERLGSVHFETTCAPDVAQAFDRGVSLLHSFWFSAAIDAFKSVAAKDPSCAMAHWGIALSHWSNPFGGFRTPQALAAGRAAAAAGLAIAKASPRERA